MAPIAIIMAAGKGTRMKSDLPKVCHEVGGRPMVCAVVDACLSEAGGAGCERVVVIVGYTQELVREALASYGDSVSFAVQDEQLGTGHAVVCAREACAGFEDRDAFVLAGDGPLIRPATLGALLDRHRAAGAMASLATAVLDDPSGYGRIVRTGDGGFDRIVEQKNATEAELEIREVNPSYYCFKCGPMFEALDRVEKNELTGEYYVTDVPAILKTAGGVVEVVDAVPAEDVLSINTLEHLAVVDRVFRERMADGGAGS